MPRRVSPLSDADGAVLMRSRTMVWASSLDVVDGPKDATAAAALSVHTNRQFMSLYNETNLPQPIQSCFMSNCSETCPVGFDSATSAGGSTPEINHGCSKKGSKRTFCCPTNNMPQCRWVGKGPACWHTGCKGDESPVTYATGGCSSGHKTLCCTNTKSDTALSQCRGYPNVLRGLRFY